MKLILLFISILSFSVFADEMFEKLDNRFEEAGIPDFLPYVGKNLSGRCLLTSGSNNKIASVLMVSFEEDGFQVVPFDALKKRDDYFDNRTYASVLKEFPVIKKMFLDVNETALGAVIYKTSGDVEYRGEIKETDKYLILRVFLNDKIHKYCNYYKK